MFGLDTAKFGTQSAGTGVFSLGTNPDARFVKDGMAFLEKQLSKIDPVVMEPLSSTMWPRDMPVKTGGGFVEGVTTFDVSYATSGAAGDSLIEENANELPIMQADFGHEVARTFIWGHYLKIPYLQQEKLMQIGMNLEETLNKGIRLYHDKTLDKNVYTGFERYGTTGLVNSPRVNRETASKAFKDATADEILESINDLLRRVWEANDCAVDGLPNHILMPVDQYAYIVKTKVGVTGDKSILTYILENNLTTNQGDRLIIAPCAWCKAVGSGGSDRMVAYVNDISRIRFDQTVPLRRLPTENALLSFQTPFVSQFSQVQFLYPSTVAYTDGI